MSIASVGREVDYTFPNGETLKLYSIGVLADAIGRKTDTIRKWEVAGFIPDSCFRDSRGWRLYSEEQINIVVKMAEKYHITQGKAIGRTSFPKKCFEGFEALREKYSRMSEVEDEVTEDAVEKESGK